MEIGFNVIVERDEEGFYVATVPELRGCHTQASHWIRSWRGSGKQSIYALKSNGSKTDPVILRVLE